MHKKYVVSLLLGLETQIPKALIVIIENEDLQTWMKVSLRKVARQDPYQCSTDYLRSGCHSLERYSGSLIGIRPW